MESSILSEVDDTSILRTVLSTCYWPALHSIGLSATPPRSGLERSDFVLWPALRCADLIGPGTFTWVIRLLSDFPSTLICAKAPSSSASVMLWFTYATMTIQTTAYTMIDAVSSHCLQKRDIGTLPPDGPSHRHSRTDGTCAA